MEQSKSHPYSTPRHSHTHSYAHSHPHSQGCVDVHAMNHHLVEGDGGRR